MSECMPTDSVSLLWSDTTAQLDWHALETLYRLAPLGNKNAADLQTVFEASRYKWFVRHQGRLIAAGRALADGADCSYICDVAVLPEWQGSGLGRELVSRLVQDSRGHKKIILYSVPGNPPVAANAVIGQPARDSRRYAGLRDLLSSGRPGVLSTTAAGASAVASPCWPLSVVLSGRAPADTDAPGLHQQLQRGCGGVLMRPDRIENQAR